MKILITQSIKGIGKAGEVKDFAQGYAQNVIIKKGYGIIATPEAISRALKLKEGEAASAKQAEESLVKAVTEANNMHIKIAVQANEYGHLFSSVNKKDILLEIKKNIHAPVTDDMLILSSPIKEVGEYALELKYKIYSSKIKLTVNKK